MAAPAQHAELTGKAQQAAECMAAHLLSKQHDAFDDCLIVGLQLHAAAAGAHICAQLDIHLGVGREAGYKGLLGGPTCTQRPSVGAAQYTARAPAADSQLV